MLAVRAALAALAVLAALAASFRPAAADIIDIGPAAAAASAALGSAAVLLLRSGESIFTARSPLPAAPPAPAHTAAVAP